MKKIAVLVLNDFTNDARVIKEVRSLSKLFIVDVYAVNTGGYKKNEKFNDNTRIFREIKYNKPQNISLKKIRQLIVYLKFLTYSFFKLKKYDAVHCNDLETLPFGVIAKFFNKQLKIIYDAHEFETETLWMQNKTKKKIAKLMEGFLIERVDKTITVSNAIAEEYSNIYSIDKPVLILNTPGFKKVVNKDIFRDHFKVSKDKMIFLYQGGFTRGRGIEMLLETFQEMKDENNVIVFMGNGDLEELVIMASKQNKNIFYHKAVSQDVLLDYTSSADFGILFYENNCLNHYYCSPNKMFEYIMAEIPVIASNLFEMKRLVEKNKIGVVAKENTAVGLQEAIQKAVKLDGNELLSNLKKVKKVYNWEEQEKKLLNFYSKLLHE